MRRSAFFLSLAAGLVASLALSAPTQAASVVYTVDAEIFVTKGTATFAIVEFNQTVMGPVTILPGTSPALAGSVGTPMNVTPSDVSFVLAPGPVVAAGSPYFLDFSVTSSTGLAGLGGIVSGPPGTQGGVVVLSVSSVPEPTSMALLGVGMAGFFAYRRLFKKRPAAA